MKKKLFQLIANIIAKNAEKSKTEDEFIYWYTIAMKFNSYCKTYDIELQ